MEPPNDSMRAIPTEYNGIQLKSRMEAQIACFMDRVGWKWEYEPISLMLKSGIAYIPDFLVRDKEMVIECRGYSSAKGDRQIADFAQEFIDRGFTYYAVLGPVDCKLYWSQKDEPLNVSLTYCPRCQEWNFEGHVPHKAALCPECIEITFHRWKLNTSEGKFRFGLTLLEDCNFDKEDARRAWWTSFIDHIFSSLGRRDLLHRDNPEVANLIRAAGALVLEGRK